MSEYKQVPVREESPVSSSDQEIGYRIKEYDSTSSLKRSNSNYSNIPTWYSNLYKKYDILPAWRTVEKFISVLIWSIIAGYVIAVIILLVLGYGNVEGNLTLKTPPIWVSKSFKIQPQNFFLSMSYRQKWQKYHPISGSLGYL